MGKELQSITQLNVSNRWYALDQQNYMFQPRGHHQVCPIELWPHIYYKIEEKLQKEIRFRQGRRPIVCTDETYIHI
jgi:hypothetical protein